MTNIIKEEGSNEYLQLCGGQKSGAEKAMTAATELFEDVASHGILTNRCKQHI